MGRIYLEVSKPQGVNILLITQEDFLAGSTYSVSYLAKGLAARGHHVIVAARENSLLQQLLADSKVKFKPLALRRRFDFKLMKELADLIVSEKIQVINAQSSKDRYLSIFTRWLYRLPVAVLHTRRQYPLSAGGALQRLIYVQGTDKIVVISDELKRIFISKGFPADHLKVIHNGIPQEKLAQWNSLKVAELAKRWCILPGDLVVGCVSRLKNQIQLIESLVHLNRPEIKVMLVGVKAGHFDEMISKLGIKNQIIYTGEVSGDEVLNYYKLFNVNVLPSTTDGFGLVLIESMAMECPVIATDFGGIKDVVKDQWKGLLFPDKDVKKLATCIERILDDQSLQQHLIKNGRATVDEIFTMDKTVVAYEKFYMELYHELRVKWQWAEKKIAFAE